MGTDNLFHKRRVRKANSHERERAKRDPYIRILIVCEGAKTEPNYFKELLKAFSLNPRNVVIADKKTGLDPLSLVNYAIEEYDKDKDFEYIYCIFDKDKHTTYMDALNKVRDYHFKKKVILKAITSIPCFEIWLLLHFTYTTRSFCAACGESDYEVLKPVLKQHLPNYEKGDEDIFFDGTMLHIAINNAKKLENYHLGSGTDNPSTKIYLIVEALKELKEKKEQKL